ncbi:MAG: DEAD/DEAH box helicase family protein [Deltaproteobacteria bacterium]|nr:DEAD/DEAH box helicase family protein [Deltaproteobacteria bacterium]
MKIRFDANQQFQLDAVSAIVDVFEGQPLQEDGVTLNFSATVDTGLLSQTEVAVSCVANNLVLSEEALLKNVQNIQETHRLPIVSQLHGKNFSIEMETGTGKTYVYLRTIFELNRRYGFKK